MKANYRKMNDGSHSSSTYYKKDGTPVRAMLERELVREIYGQRANQLNGVDVK